MSGVTLGVLSVLSLVNDLDEVLLSTRLHYHLGTVLTVATLPPGQIVLIVVNLLV